MSNRYIFQSGDYLSPLFETEEQCKLFYEGWRTARHNAGLTWAATHRVATREEVESFLRTSVENARAELDRGPHPEDWEGNDFALWEHTQTWSAELARREARLEAFLQEKES